MKTATLVQNKFCYHYKKRIKSYIKQVRPASIFSTLSGCAAGGWQIFAIGFFLQARIWLEMSVLLLTIQESQLLNARQNNKTPIYTHTLSQHYNRNENPILHNILHHQSVYHLIYNEDFVVLIIFNSLFLIKSTCTFEFNELSKHMSFYFHVPDKYLL